MSTLENLQKFLEKNKIFIGLATAVPNDYPSVTILMKPNYLSLSYIEFKESTIVTPKYEWEDAISRLSTLDFKEAIEKNTILAYDGKSIETTILKAIYENL